MRRVIVGLVGLAAFCGILAAAFIGGGPGTSKPLPKAPEGAGVAAGAITPPKPPEPLLGVEVAPADGERHGARMSTDALRQFDTEMAAVSASPGTSPRVAREAESLWGTKKSISTGAEGTAWVVAVDPPAENAPAASAAQIAVALSGFQALFEKRFAPLFAAHPPPAGWVGPVVILPSRDEYLRRTHPRMFATSHTDLPSGWSYVAWTGRDLRPALFHEATCQLWRALSRGWTPGGIPVSRLSAWFWLGTAEFFEGSPIALEGSDSHDVGDEWHEETRKIVREGRVRRLKEFLAVRQADLDAESDPLRIFAFRAQAWAFVNFLETSGGGKRRELLDRFAGFELSGKGGLEAATECFGDLDAFDGEFQNVLPRGK